MRAGLNRRFGNGHSEVVRDGRHHGIEAIQESVECATIGDIETGGSGSVGGGHGCCCVPVCVGHGHFVTAPDEIPDRSRTHNSCPQDHRLDRHDAPHCVMV